MVIIRKRNIEIKNWRKTRFNLFILILYNSVDESIGGHLKIKNLHLFKEWDK